MLIGIPAGDGEAAHEMNVDCDIHAFTRSRHSNKNNHPAIFDFPISFFSAYLGTIFASTYVLRYHTSLRYSSVLMFMSTFVHSHLSFISPLELPLSQTLSRFSIFDFLI